MTGMAYVAGLPVFAASINFDNITLQKPYTSICGFTQEELESYFSEHIDSVAGHLKITRENLLEQIRDKYSGYTWDGKTAIYNPVSILMFFVEQQFADYWFHSGAPTCPLDIVQRYNNINYVLEPFVDSSINSGYDPLNIDVISLLFLNGYLTVKQEELIDGCAQYTLGVPNPEVNNAILMYLLKAYGKYSDKQINELRITMEQQINNCDEAGFTDCLKEMTAAVPNKTHHHYYSLMLLWMRLLNFKVHRERLDFENADAIREQPGICVVAKIKYFARTKIDILLKTAMMQIHEKRYYNRYSGKILLLGIAFSGKNTGCTMEVLNR
jgi:hypothetical protein